MNIRMSMFAVLILATSLSCEQREFEFDDPARGPGEFVGQDGKVSAADFVGGNDQLPDSTPIPPQPDGFAPDCGANCVQYCEGLGFENPVNRGLCQSLWGVGYMHQPVVKTEACRRMFVDMIGRFPTRGDIVETCDGKSYGEVALNLINRDEFIAVNQRRWADKLLYDTQSVSIERIYDMDKLVGKLYAGQVAYDEFAAVVSAHPILTRRHDTPEDRAEALFWLFTGRPPLGNERTDMGRLYNVWHNGYYDHPELGMRVADAHIRFRCVNEDGEIDNATRGECTSILWGKNELIMKPDIRAFQQDEDSNEVTMWSGLLRTEEWEKLQIPGRILGQQRMFWEAMVDDVLIQYLGYDLGTEVPTVREELVRYALEYNGDIRAIHFAVVSSAAYIQSANGETPTNYRWTFGPSKQVESEAWVDTIKHMTGYDLATCDHRLTRPEDFLESDTIGGIALLERSNWEFNSEGVDYSYRDVVRGLGGCPDNSIGGRFKLVSILTTAQQLNFVSQVCDPAFEGGGVGLEHLLPDGISRNDNVSSSVAEEIFEHPVNLFYGRRATEAELEAVRGYADDCNCEAGAFARPTCFAVLSSSEMLFY